MCAALGPNQARLADTKDKKGAAMSNTTILVGYDGSPGSEDALAWAAREARARGSVLTVCVARGLRSTALPTEGAAPGEEVQGGNEDALAAGLRCARDLMGEGDVRPLLVAGPPSAVLCKQCAHAEMLVVGSLGSGGLPDLRIGSVAFQVAAHAQGRVVIGARELAPCPWSCRGRHRRFPRLGTRSDVRVRGGYAPRDLAVGRLRTS